MAGSSLLVALNALLLKRTRLPGIRATQPDPQGETPQSAPVHVGALTGLARPPSDVL